MGVDLPDSAAKRLSLEVAAAVVFVGTFWLLQASRDPTSWLRLTLERAGDGFRSELDGWRDTLRFEQSVKDTLDNLNVKEEQ